MISGQLALRKSSTSPCICRFQPLDMPQERPTVDYKEHIDTSIIARYPSGFLQKALNLQEATIMQHTKDRVFLRKKNGQIITWAKYSKNDAK